MPLEIWLPQSARPAFKCAVGDCDLTFTEDEKAAYIRHVAAHSQQLDAEIAQETDDHFGSNFTGRSLDPERERFLRDRQRAGHKIDWWKEGAVH